MEGLEIKLFSNIYKDKRVLVTGHSGFKGSWLSLWLKKLGANVCGISLPPEVYPNHWQLLDLNIENHYQDIREKDKLGTIIQKFSPEIIFHLAAQPLVRRSYKKPLLTWTTNVIGSANLLDVSKELLDLKAILIITSDKCYENYEQEKAYVETDPLGGHDPYSASKAATELVAASYRKSFYSDNNSALVASARAGNVIGGGDWSVDRLIPDLVKSNIENQTLNIRYPNATRPWQHVLESLNGYLQLGEKLLQGKNEFAAAWNFGPNKNSNKTVSSVLTEFKKYWPEIEWQSNESNQPHEAELLHLDSTKSRERLGWKPILEFSETVKLTAEWYKTFETNNKIISEKQLTYYSNLLV